MKNFLQTLLDSLPEESRYILYEGLQYSTQAQIYEAMLKLETEVIAPMLQKKGKDSEEYKFFMLLKNILYQAGEADYMIEELKSDCSISRQLCEFLTQRNAHLEKELQKYRTVEELKGDGYLQLYINRVNSAMVEKYKFDKKQATE